jgi:hypothetical protein
MVRRLGLEPLEDRRLLSAGGQQTIQLFDASPALFVQNQGQIADASIRYAFQGSGANVLMTDSGVIFQVSQKTAAATPQTPNPLPPMPAAADAASESEQFSATFLGANSVAPVGRDQSATVYNYLVGDRSQWRQNVPAYQQVAYNGLYSGIDLVTSGQRDHLKYEFHVAPGADYAQIKVHYQGIEGLWLDGQGVLHVQTALGEMTDSAPVIYQVVDGHQVAVAGQFQLIDQDTYAFTVTGAYDRQAELVIDPVVDWSTCIHGTASPETGETKGQGVAVDADGNALITGYTNSPNVIGATGSYHGGLQDAFVAKISSSGTLLWSIYLGGGGDDIGYGIAVDSEGNALVAGYTGSADLAGANNSLSGSRNAFVAKVGADGTLLWSTYVGGSSFAEARGIGVDGEGNALVTGVTASTDLALATNSYHGGEDAYVAKVSSDGALLWSTYLGGSNYDFTDSIAVDSHGNALVTGETMSTDFAGANNSYRGDYNDAFVAKVGSDGTFLWSTYLGGTGYDWGYGIAVDSHDDALVTGNTQSTDFVGANNSKGDQGTFVAKVASTGSLAWATYSEAYGRCIAVDSQDDALVFGNGVTQIDGNGTLVGSISYRGGSDYVGGIAVDGLGNIVIAGWAQLGYPGVLGNEDAFVTKVSSSGDVAWATLVGGDLGLGTVKPLGVAADAEGNALITGYTDSTDIAGTNNSFQGGRDDAFLAKIGSDGTLLWVTYLGGSGDDSGYGVAVDSEGNALVTGWTQSSDFAGANNLYYGPDTNGVDAFVAKVRSDGTLLWSTYVGGSDYDHGYGIALDSEGNALVTGNTCSVDFAEATNSSYGGNDAFVAKVNSDDGTLLWSTYLGGSDGNDYGQGIAVDSEGNALVTGNTESTNFAEANNSFDGEVDAFVAKVNNDGTLLWSTYLGGSSYDYGQGIAVDSQGSALITGYTESMDFAGSNGPPNGSIDGYLAKISGSGTFLWSTYFNGTFGTGVVVDSQGDALVMAGNVIIINSGGKTLGVISPPGLYANSIAVDSRDNVLVAGYFAYSNGDVGREYDNAYVVKILGPITMETTTTLVAGPNPSVGLGRPVTFTATVESALSGAGAPTGSVTFMDGDTPLGTGELSNGTASFRTAGLAVGDHTIAAVYSGDQDYHESTGSVTQTVVLAPYGSTTTLTASVDHSVFSQSLTFTALVAPVNAPKGMKPTNTVSFVIDDGPEIPVQVGSNRKAVLKLSLEQLSTLEPGSHLVTAIYDGDENFGVSIASLTQTVNQATTTTRLAAPTSSSYGRTVTLKAIVTKVSPAKIKPTSGTVTFYDGDTVLGTVDVEPDSRGTGRAWLVCSGLPAASYQLRAQYSGTADYTASSSDTVTLAVAPAITKTKLIASSTSAIPGQTIDLTVNVTTRPLGRGTPPGLVTFWEGSTNLGTVELDSNGQAQMSLPDLSLGKHPIYVTYGAAPDFETSTSGTVTLSVAKVKTATELIASSTSTIFGEAVVFTANVTSARPELGAPTGTVTFWNGATSLGTAELDSNGQAQVSTSDLSVGNRRIKITYGADSIFNASTSSSVTVTVQASQLTLSPSTQIRPGGIALDSQAALASIVTAAKQRLEAKLGVGIDAALAGLKVAVANLPGKLLGEEAGKTILIDRDAAGCGWFIDPTPVSDEEFVSSSGKQQLQAIDPRAVDRIDLLTVMEHELGHVLGLKDLDAASDDLMSGVLEVGIRRNASAADAVLALL